MLQNPPPAEDQDAGTPHPSNGSQLTLRLEQLSMLTQLVTSHFTNAPATPARARTANTTACRASIESVFYETLPAPSADIPGSFDLSDMGAEHS
jgi:hypothetical protein